MTFQCGCGKAHRIDDLGHYDRAIISPCGTAVWALRPKRNGPLVLFPWPGHHKTREEMGRGPSAETIVRRMR
jgi:hypothetical protein